MYGYQQMLEKYWVNDGLMVSDPASGDALGTVTDYDIASIEAAIIDAQAARTDWANRTAKERSQILRRWFALILENSDSLAELCTLESGKPLIESKGEVAYAASFIEWFAEEAKRINGEIIPPPAMGKKILVHKLPIGVTAAITPWNFPLAMITRKAGPALAAGCAMIVKPAAETPLSALALETLAHEAGIPQAIFAVRPSSAAEEVGKLFCEHPLIRKLSFTGSTHVGKILMQQAASTVTRLSLELGGNAPFIVFNDADIDQAVAGAIASKYRNSGQTCVCANRFLVQADIYDDFVKKLSDSVEQMQLGHGLKPETKLGPLISQKAVHNVGRLVKDAVESGAQFKAGRLWQEEDGAFHPACVLSDVTTNMEIVHSEIFGPIAPVIRFEEESEAIQIANDTPYGLAAYAYTQDQSRSWRLMQSLDYGMVGINEGIISTEMAPFGGVKESGLGREGSSHGIDEYLEIKYCLLGGLST